MSHVIELVLAVIAIALTNLRWMRVAQREHYLAGSVSRFAMRWWWNTGIVNRALFVIALIAFVVGSLGTPGGIVTAAIFCIAPIGFSLLGRTSKLVFTRRLNTVVIATVLMQLVAIALCAIFFGVAGAGFGSVVVLLVTPSVIDVCLRLLAPWEDFKARSFVSTAAQRIKTVNPAVVAITGSYGKTTTKNYLSTVLGEAKAVVATPASFNNRAGLSRAINEHLTPGTEIFIAEMGTYGKGEIAELCEFCPPNIAVLTAIGPVHLERFGSEEAIIGAKSEIFSKASVCVVNIDDDRLRVVADELSEQGKLVWRCSTQEVDADICVRESADGIEVFGRGQQLFDAGQSDAVAINVALTIAVAFECGLTLDQVAAGLASIPQVPHRGDVQRGARGQFVIDDTFNANPASVRRSLGLLHAIGNGQKILVTPGMVELGVRQKAENFEFARLGATVASDVIVVGKTNRRALCDGVYEAGKEPIVVGTLGEAVAWVRKNTDDGDTIAYVNDLPDHFA